jgi:hypothetical protein
MRLRGPAALLAVAALVVAIALHLARADAAAEAAGDVAFGLLFVAAVLPRGLRRRRRTAASRT